MAHTSSHPAVRRHAARWSIPTSLPPPRLGLDQEPPPDDRPVEFSTLVAPAPQLERVVDVWPSLIERSGLPPLAAPVIMPLSPAAQPYAEGALRIAVAHHPPGLGGLLVNTLNAQLAQAGILGVLVEEGFFLEPVEIGRTAQSRSATGPWSIQWTREHPGLLLQPPRVELPAHMARSTSRNGGTRRVALIDTGDEGANVQIFCRDDDSDFEPPGDPTGHGTSVGSLLRMVAPQAEVHCYRVLEPGEAQVAVPSLLEAVNEVTMQQGLFSVVCIPQRATVSRKHLGRYKSLHRIIAHNHETAATMPMVVCAAGNNPSSTRLSMSFPATEPGFLVALGLDWSGEVADYNCQVPLGTSVHLTYAYGGTKAQPVGTIQRPGTGPQPFYGSSYASALVAGALLLGA